MMAHVRGTSHPPAAHASQKTAPVAEFRCLFTHDIRRKQKRWQDGYLKFHTFNNRVMVYDQTRYFLGDTYYKDSNELHEGDELTLDKGIMVEVADAVGVTQTDLTPLDKTPKEPSTRPNATAPLRPFQPPSSVAPSNASRATLQPRHKSLNSLLGTPKGPIGKSVPMQSPYEARKEKEREREQENEWEEGRTSKRQKTASHSTISRVSSPPADESPAPSKNLPLWARTSDAESARVPRRPIPQGAAVITLDSSPDRISAIFSDVTLPCTSPGVARSRPKSPVAQAPPPIAKQAVLENPIAKTPKIPRGKVPVPHVKAMETPKQPAPASSPPVSASNRLTNVDFALRSAQKSPVQKSSAQYLSAPEPQKELVPPPSPPRNPKMKSLRLSAGVKRGMLLCQSLPQQAPSAQSKSKVSSGRHQARASSEARKDPSPLLDPQAKPVVSAKISASSKRKALTLSAGEVSKRARTSASPLDASLDMFDDPQIVHGLLDQQLMVPSSPIGLQHPGRPPSPPVTKVPKPKSATTDRPARKETVTRKSSPLTAAAVEISQSPPPRETSITQLETSETYSRNSSTSPCKLPLFTDNFHKKSKDNQPQCTISTPAPEPIPAPRNETVALPPHPPRTGRKGPLMTTTELAALLQKPKKPHKDPILDEEHSSHPDKSPARNFRRVRSENDAPIPSISEEWERRNLPDPRTTDGEMEVVEVEVKKKPSGLAALVKKTDPRRKFQRTRSLTVNTDVSVEEAEEVDLPSPVVDEDVGPWSTEAFDLFDWRPPLKEST